jgi:hypothetical protein
MPTVDTVTANTARAAAVVMRHQHTPAADARPTDAVHASSRRFVPALSQIAEAQRTPRHFWRPGCIRIAAFRKGGTNDTTQRNDERTSER